MNDEIQTGPRRPTIAKPVRTPRPNPLFLNEDNRMGSAADKRAAAKREERRRSGVTVGRAYEVYTTNNPAGIADFQPRSFSVLQGYK